MLGGFDDRWFGNAEIDEDPGEWSLDATRLEFALGCLGGRTVRCIREAPGLELLIEKIDRLFREFHRLHRYRTLRVESVLGDR